MSNPYRVVRLLKNQLYPTYQLHGYMANKKTAPQDGLRLAGLLTMEWLRQRLGEYAPEELLRLPESSSYLDVDNSVLPSLHINSGFLVDIVSLPEQGIWTLQITEPDLGSDPGNPEQARQAVPGRVIETNVGFKIVGTQLECGFQTMISDPEGTPEQAEVYRLSVVRRLAEHPDFGLKQLTKLTGEPFRLTTVSQLKDLSSVWKNENNQLPCVIFTYARETSSPLTELPKLAPLSGYRSAAFPPLPSEPIPVRKTTVAELPYDVETFSRSGMTFCRSYILEDSLFERFASMLAISAQHGDIVVLEPPCFGGKTYTLPYKLSKTRQEETLAQLKTRMHHYPQSKPVSFGHIEFLSTAREGLLRRTADAMQESAENSEQWAQKLKLLEVQWKEELQKREQAYAALTEQLERQRQYQDRIEKEKEALRQKQIAEQQRFERLLADKDEDIAYLKRKLGQPKEHGQIAAWVKENFAGRLLLHTRAVTLLEDKSARSVSVELICDALDFLATDYWERRYARISTEEMNSRCSEKYGRPFEVKPTGTKTIEFTPAQYKVKYFPGALGKPVESPLDYHLGVGNDPENLLRIYFLHDDTKKLIVVGSLPRHLKAVTIK